MVELVDTLDLGSSACEGVRVRVSVGALGICKLLVGFIRAYAFQYDYLVHALGCAGV